MKLKARVGRMSEVVVRTEGGMGVCFPDRNVSPGPDLRDAQHKKEEAVVFVPPP